VSYRRGVFILFFFFQAVSKQFWDEVAFKARDINALGKLLNYVNMVIEKKYMVMRGRKAGKKVKYHQAASALL
jgi:hypothetical protein